MDTGYLTTVGQSMQFQRCLCGPGQYPDAMFDIKETITNFHVLINIGDLELY